MVVFLNIVARCLYAYFINQLGPDVSKCYTLNNVDDKVKDTGREK